MKIHNPHIKNVSYTKVLNKTLGVLVLLFLLNLSFGRVYAQKRLETVKVENKSKKTSKSMKGNKGKIEPAGSQSQGPKRDNYIKVDPGREKSASQKLSKYRGDMAAPSAGGRSQGPKNSGAMVDQRESKSEGPRHGGAMVDQRQSKSEGPKQGGAMIDAPKNNQKKLSQSLGSYSGDIDPGNNSRSQGPRNAGSYVIVDPTRQKKLSKQMSEYSGDIDPGGESRSQGPRNSDAMVLVREENRKEMKRMANYSGDLPNNFLEKRAEYRQEKNRKVSNYKGDILVKTLEARDKRTRKKSKQMANYQGDLVVKRVRSGMHPSAVYRGGQVKNSYAAKEKYRKKMLRKYGRNDGLEDANYQKEKIKKPKYNKDESEIWY